MRLELSSPVKSYQIEQLELCLMELDLSAQQVVRQAHSEPQNYSAPVDLPAVLDNVGRISRQCEELALLARVVALAQSEVPEIDLMAEDSDHDVGDEEVVLSVAVPVNSDSTVAAAVAPVDNSLSMYESRLEADSRALAAVKPSSLVREEAASMRLMPENSMVAVHCCSPRSTTSRTVRHSGSECRTSFDAEPHEDLSPQTNLETDCKLVATVTQNARHSVDRRSSVVTMPWVPQRALLSLNRADSSRRVG